MENIAIKNNLLSNRLGSSKLQANWNGYTKNHLLCSTTLTSGGSVASPSSEYLLKCSFDTRCKLIKLSHRDATSELLTSTYSTGKDVGRLSTTGLKHKVLHQHRQAPVTKTVQVSKNNTQVNDLQLPDYSALIESNPCDVTPAEVILPEVSEEKLLQEKIVKAKQTLVNAIQAALVEPGAWKNPESQTCQFLLSMISEIASHDPEFVLKLAAYSRTELHLRNPTNFLFAAAAHQPKCLPFLSKYVHHCIGLPTDWLTVVEYYAILSGKSKLSLPKALRKALVEKFPEFNMYQLGKYKKDHVSKKVREKQIGRTEFQFSLKFLVRYLHIREPAEHVMCLLGKKYPATLEEFKACRLPGDFDESRAGKRMKTPVPVTWETQVSSQGNTAVVWENMIGEKQLPYMATLRNLRNLLCAGLGDKYHCLVTQYLSNEKAVINSKQLPQQFLAASKALDELGTHPDNFTFDLVLRTKKPKVEQLQKHRVYVANCKRLHSRIKNFHNLPNHASLVAQYKAALERAFELSSAHNIPPVPGKTVIVMDVDTLEDSIQQKEFLLTVMCYMACEKPLLYLETLNDRFVPITLSSSSLLKGAQELRELFNSKDTRQKKIGMDELLKAAQADHVVYIAAISHPDPLTDVVKNAVYEYRSSVKPMLLLVHITVGRSRSYFDETRHSSNSLDLYVHGPSEQVLKLIAEKGNQHQITHVDTIDKRLRLKILPPKLASHATQQQHYANIPSTPRWRVLRVFVSSTFKDLHGERDLLARFVFPEVQALAYRHRLSVMDVDLRWGLTEEEARSDKLLELCLNEVSKCQIFIGILGERYGWVPESYQVDEATPFDWLKEFPAGASVTELEFYAGALAHAEQMKDRAFFYFRDPGFYAELTEDIKADFIAPYPKHRQKLINLKLQVKQAGFEVFDEYPASYGGLIQGKPMAVGLEEFGKRVLDNLWQAVQQYCEEEGEGEAGSMEHVMYAEALAHECIDLKALDIGCEEIEHDGVILVTGQSGSGKTRFLARLQAKFSGGTLLTVPWFADVAGASSCSPLEHVTNVLLSFLENKPSYSKFEELLSDVALASHGVVILLDALQAVGEDVASQMLNALPQKLPTGVRVFVTCSEDSFIISALFGRKDVTRIEIEKLDLVDRKCLIKHRLALHGQKLDESLLNDQLREALNKLDAGNPRYLQVLCNELRALKVFEEVSNKLKEFRGTLSSLLQEVLQRLEDELGQQLVLNALLLLLASKEGLYEDELRWSLTVALAQPKDFKKISSQYGMLTRISATSFFRLVYSIKPFTRLATIENHVVLEKGLVQEAITKRYGKHLHLLLDYHRILAGYFSHVCVKAKDVHIARALQWLPYHLSHAGEFDMLSQHVCNLSFVEAKLRANMGESLHEDLRAHDAPISPGKHDFLSSKLVLDYQRFIRKNLTTLWKYPMATLQQALGEDNCSEVYIHALALSTSTSSLNFKLKNPYKSAFISSYSLPVDQVATAMDCDLTTSSLAMGTSCGDILVFKQGKRVWKLTGHGSSIAKLAFLPSNRLVSADVTGSMSIWSLINGIRSKAISAHSKRITDLVVNTQHNFIITTSLDRSVKIWELDGHLVNSLTTGSPVNCVALVPGILEIITGEWNGEAVVWDLTQVKRVGMTNVTNKGRRQPPSIRDIRVLPDGLTFITVDVDGCIKLWCKATHTLLAKWEHAFQVTGMQIDGEQILLQGINGLIELWNLPADKEIARISHPELGSAGITAIAMSIVNKKEILLAVALSSGVVELRNLTTAETARITFASSKPIKALELQQQYLLAATDKQIYIHDLLTEGTALCNLPVTCVFMTANYFEGILWIVLGALGVAGFSEFFVYSYSGKDKLYEKRVELEAQLLELKLNPETNELLVISQAGRSSFTSVYKISLEDTCLECALSFERGLELSNVVCGSWIDPTSIVLGTRGGQIYQLCVEEEFNKHLIYAENMRSPITSVTAQGGKVLAAYGSGEILLLSQSGKVLHSMRNLEGGYVVGLMSNGEDGSGDSKIVVALGSSTIRVHQLYRMEKLEAFPSCSRLASFQGKRIAVYDNRNVLSLYEVDLSLSDPSKVVHESVVTSLGLSADGKRAFSFSGDGTVLLWDLTVDPPAPRQVHCETEGKWLGFLGKEGESVLIREPEKLTRVFLNYQSSSIEPARQSAPKPLLIIPSGTEDQPLTGKEKDKVKKLSTVQCIPLLFAEKDDDPMNGFLNCSDSDSDSDTDSTDENGDGKAEVHLNLVCRRITLSGRLITTGGQESSKYVFGNITDVVSKSNGNGLAMVIKQRDKSRVWMWDTDNMFRIVTIREKTTCDCSSHSFGYWSSEHICKLTLGSPEEEMYYVKADGRIRQATLVGKNNNVVSCIETPDGPGDRGVTGRNDTIAVWPVELLRIGDFIICGLSDGSAYFGVPHNLRLYMLHDRKITGLCILRNDIISASLDGTIRVWKLPSDSQNSLEQIAVYDHGNPINALSCLQCEDSPTVVMFGDVLGNVQFLHI